MRYNVEKLQQFAKFVSSENNPSQFALTISFTDPELTNAERDDEVVQLLEALNDRSDIDAVDRVRDPNPPKGNKSVGGFFVGMLMAEVSAANAKKVLGFLVNRLGDKPISFEVEGNGKKLKVSASSREELEFAMQKAREFIEA
ncbi:MULTISPECIES: hypothetical protein [Pseudanabaena]|uniref:hypothetical protein n=1 Tax=Pseudanabaena TaxID=1152 RepID=UPI002479D160|nr:MULTISPECIES: hypothetical protein [Pseudanabaena]MEA5489532.1 hypothetical protein [Pseudanabaena sp. CCNP1317]WGS74777.1 hypothetical protein OA858_22520 [Pseudanabaena galeata CCNP1313]